MATQTTSGNQFPGRTFEIKRDTNTDRAYWFEWIDEIPDQKGQRKFLTLTSKNGKVRNYELFTAISGYLTGIEIEEKSFGDYKPAEKWLMIYMQDGHEQYKLQAGEVSDRYSLDIMKRLLDKNFDPLQTLRLSPFAKKQDNGKWMMFISAYSGPDGQLSAKKDDPHLQGIPQPETTQHKGETLWDFTPIARWLFARIQKEVIPNLGGSIAPINTTVTANHSDDFPTEAPPVQTAPASVPDDDLPF